MPVSQSEAEPQKHYPKSNTKTTHRLDFISEDITHGVDWHINSDDHSVILHLGGPITQLESEINGKGGQMWGARPGELWLVPAGHSYHSRAAGGKISYAVMSFPQDTPDDLFPQMARYDPFLLSCFRRLAGIQPSQSPHAPLLVEQLEAIIQTHVLISYRHEPKRVKRRIADDVKFLSTEREKLISFIEAHIDQRLTIKRLAAITDRTPHQLLDACYDAFGMAPSHLVMERRLRRARDLLSSTRETITEIAAASGFSSHSHLIRAFQQHYAMTPGQFRSEWR